MSLPRQHLVLLVPGLCGPGSGSPARDYLQPRPDALDSLLSHSKPVQHGGAGLDAALCRWFGLDDCRPDNLPVAPLTHRSDTGLTTRRYILRADPVHLRANQSKLHLFESDTFSIAQHEADELADAFNSFYSERGWELHAPCPRRWYLTLAIPPLMETTAIARVGGQDINSFLPLGDDAVGWHQVMNEVQMLFHDHPVNVAREQNGEPAINSLWFWGGGYLPDMLQARTARIATDHPLGMGLALQADVLRADVPADSEELLAQIGAGVTLVVNDGLASAAQYGDIDRWAERLRDLEQHWFVPLLKSLRQGGLSSLEIDPCAGASFITGKRQLLHFWKRNRPFERVCFS